MENGDRRRGGGLREGGSSDSAGRATPPGRLRAPSRARVAVRLVLFLLVLYNANLREISSADTIPNRLLPLALLREGRPYLDRFTKRPAEPEGFYWMQQARGHYVSSYPIVPAVMAVPVYALPVLAGIPESWALVNALSKFTASLLAAASAGLLYVALSRVSGGTAALWLSLVYALGTSTWSVSSQGLWGHAPAQFLLAVALWRLASDLQVWWSSATLGLAAGLMVATRPPTVLLALALLGEVWRRGWRGGCWALAGHGAGLFPFLAYDLWHFGTLEGGATPRSTPPTPRITASRARGPRPFTWVSQGSW